MRISWKNQAIAMIISPAFGFLIAYQYESRFCEAFNIPKEFIELSWLTILSAFSAIVGIFTLLFLVTNVLFMIFGNIETEGKEIIQAKVIRIAPVTLLAFSSLLLYRTLWRESLWMIGMAVFLFFLEFVLPLITERKVKGYLKKFIANEERDAYANKKSLFSIMFSEQSNNILIVFVVLIMIWIIAGMAGNSNAKLQRDFLIPSTYPEAVVLRVYGDNLVCAQFDRSSKEIDNAFFVIRVDEVPKPRLTLNEVGPLTVKKK